MKRYSFRRQLRRRWIELTLHGQPGRITWPEVASIVGAYAALTLIATYPAMAFFETHFIGAGDTVQNAWNLWWMQQSIGEGVVLPSFTRLLYHPMGVSLAYHPTSPLNGWMSTPLQRWLGMSLPATYNLLTMATFIASAVGMHVVVRQMGGSLTSAAVAGVVFAFSPVRVSRVSFGNLEMYSTQFLPPLVYCLCRISETKRWRYVAGAAIALALTGYCSLNLLLGAGLWSLVHFILQLRSDPDRRALCRRWLAVVGIAFALMAPLVWPMLRDYAEFRDQADQTTSALANSADLLGFIVPDESRLYGLFYGNSAEKQVFIGFTVLIMLVAVVLASWSAATRLWTSMAGLFAILSLGPALHVAGRTVWPFLPYALLLNTPMISFGRTPARLAMFVMLAIALAVGVGWASLEQQSPQVRRATPLLGLLVFIEFLRLPMPLDSRPAEIPEYYYHLADSGDSGPMLDVPVDLYGAQGPGGDYMLYQTVHHQPIVGGYISRTPSRVLQLFDHPLVRQLRVRIYDDRAPWVIDASMIGQGLGELQTLGIRRVALHTNFLSLEDAGQARAALTMILGQPEFDDGRLAVWLVP